MKHVNINELMELTGKSFRTVKRVLQPLKPVREDGRAAYFDSIEALKLLYPTQASEMAEEELKLERARREKIEIEVKVLKGQFAPVSEFAKTVEREYTYVRSQVRALSNKLAKPLSMVSDANEVFTRLNEAIDECLSELTADAKYRLESERVETLGKGAVAGEGDESQADTATELGGVGGPEEIPESGE